MHKDASQSHLISYFAINPPPVPRAACNSFDAKRSVSILKAPLQSAIIVVHSISKVEKAKTNASLFPTRAPLRQTRLPIAGIPGLPTGLPCTVARPQLTSGFAIGAEHLDRVQDLGTSLPRSGGVALTITPL